MGQSEGNWYFLWIDLLEDAIDREIMYEDAEWDALNLQAIRCWPRPSAQGLPQMGTGNLCWPDGLPP